MLSICPHIEQKSLQQGDSIAAGNVIRDLLIRAEKDQSLLHRVEARELINAKLFELAATNWAEVQEMDVTERLEMVIDSLVAMEMRSWMRRKLDLGLAMPQIAKAKTVRGLMVWP
ncbi:hypothetical protein BO86DRAFT_386933 [Aspergillus japonicus CBS 114.51]|uniref:Carrier domain-containing protein n=2 Tax=Aspergillus TaxID=5052 RepID=A0A2V5HGG4_ASPV1|nr:hypothetical protein BO86DRAFT_386933 [Aspergillus japonicus CBS 114.51]PYI23455.1 hypothetical protein BO99DRAFT_398985 [Aspergillus violaceofuscus CBS 115571]RAH84287.1 hypothetical protein BO86DRAFT_386933 [Aspergillus japonicus CBS 114.51]